jgi:ectoine hydroxylase-related dioxygenase (phytanoyl-CoA dioxygenase family)
MHGAALRTEDLPTEPAFLLRRDGYCVLREVAPSGKIAELEAELAPRFRQTPFCEGHFNGFRTKRFHGLLKRSKGAASLIANETILGIAEEILLPFCDTLQLNLTQAVEIFPGALAQVPHRDQDMWPGKTGEIEYGLNVMWPLTSFTAENGGTLVWPGSHRRQDERSLLPEQAIAPELGPGDVLMFLGSTLHGGGANLTLAPRRGILVSYCLGWLKPYENMWLTYPPEIAASFPPELRDLIGYRRHRPNLGNYDGQCPSILFGPQPMEHGAATDALTAEQERALAAFVAGQSGEGLRHA